MATTINFGGGTATQATQPVNTGRNKSKGISNDTWKKVAIGGISAIAFGGAAYAATSLLNEEEPVNLDDQENPVEEETAVAEETVATTPAADFHPSMQMATSVNDDMTFAEAFAAARAEVHAGGMFEWHGNVYGTYYGNEWDALSPDQQSAFTAGTSQVASHHVVDTTPQEEVAHVEVEVDDTHVQPQKPANDDDVADVRVERVDYDPENEASVAYVTVDDTDVILTDIDNDGVFDVLYVDENGNGLVDENEILDISDESITVAGLGGYTEPMLDINDDFMANNDIDIDSIEL